MTSKKTDPFPSGFNCAIAAFYTEYSTPSSPSVLPIPPSSRFVRSLYVEVAHAILSSDTAMCELARITLEEVDDEDSNPDPIKMRGEKGTNSDEPEGAEDGVEEGTTMGRELGPEAAEDGDPLQERLFAVTQYLKDHFPKLIFAFPTSNRNGDIGDAFDIDNVFGWHPRPPGNFAQDPKSRLEVTHRVYVDIRIYEMMKKLELAKVMARYEQYYCNGQEEMLGFFFSVCILHEIARVIRTVFGSGKNPTPKKLHRDEGFAVENRVFGGEVIHHSRLP